MPQAALLTLALLLEAPLAEPAVVVVFVPGTTGTIMRDVDSGRVHWGNARSLFFPRDRGRKLALPLRFADAGMNLKPDGPIEAIRIGPYVKPIYAPLLAAMGKGGYRIGRLDAPGPADTFFVFGYDWRLDNVANARRLAERLEAVRRAAGDETLRVSLIAQSSGAHLARYLVKYGGASLAEAERGVARPPAGIEFERLILVGTANGGALRVLRDFNRGRRYVLFGRRFAPEVLFTFRSLYQDLPVYTDDLFVDEAGGKLEVDLFDPETWRRYQWSIYAPPVARRLARSDPGQSVARNDYLRERLAEARRFHRLLQADAPGFGATRYYSLQNVSDSTPARALLERREGRWRTSFSGDRAIQRNPRLRALVSTPGDGHAVLASQQWLSPQERATLAARADFDGGHFELIVNPDAIARLLEYLREP